MIKMIWQFENKNNTIPKEKLNVQNHVDEILRLEWMHINKENFIRNSIS